MLEIVKSFIENSKKLRIAIIGETIIDEFIKVDYEGPSMKSACPVYKLSEDSKQIQEGGTLAIFNHLKHFVADIDLITNTENEIVKTRFIDRFDSKKHVEINKILDFKFERQFVDCNKYDVVIVADFGHGFCDKIDLNDGFHLMCQTNSNNFGFNRTSKWKNNRKKSVCLDLREASLQKNRRISFTNESQKFQEEIVDLYNYELNSEVLIVTLGGNGSVFCDGQKVEFTNAYPSDIVDSIGAGDTFFAFSALQTALNSKDSQLIVPSLAASLSTTWLCNEKSVTPKTLLEYASKFV